MDSSGTLLHIFTVQDGSGNSWSGAGDLTIAIDYLYMSTGGSNVMAIQLSTITSGISTSSPSNIRGNVIALPLGSTSGVGFEIFQGNYILWVGDSSANAATAFSIDVDGSFPPGASSISTAYYGDYVKGIAIVTWQTNILHRFMAVSRCTYAQDYTCTVEFLSMQAHDTTSDDRTESNDDTVSQPVGDDDHSLTDDGGGTFRRRRSLPDYNFILQEQPTGDIAMYAHMPL